MSRKTDRATTTQGQAHRAEAFSPATLKVIGTYENTPAEEVRGVVERARAAQRVWAATDHPTRAQHLLDARRYLIEHSEEVARVISTDNGKPHIEALLTEVFPIVDLIGYFAKEAGRFLTDKPLSLHNPLLLNKRSLVRRDPLGVIGVIAPWNYPFTIPMGEVVLGLLAGNGVVLKGSSVTPLVADMISQVMAAAQLPAGLFSVVQGPGGEVGAALVGAGIDKLSFTGSVEVGRQVMSMAAEHLTPVKLELGGKDPAIVRADANLERTAAGLVWAAFMNAGQTCASLERVYVVRDVADELIERVVEQTAKLRVGFDEGAGASTWGRSPMRASSGSSRSTSPTLWRRARAFARAGGAPKVSTRRFSPAISTPRRCSPGSTTGCVA
jgi:acyl-CoA reductase-like NAD-dependent aldehyde dehydrogenase